MLGPCQNYSVLLYVWTSYHASSFVLQRGVVVMFGCFKIETNATLEMPVIVLQIVPGKISTTTDIK